MGSYINPRNETKEQFLVKNGSKVSASFKYEDIPQDKMMVCLVNNGFFTAAGIMFDEREYDDFHVKGDTRPKDWYLVDKNLLLDEEVSDLKFYLKSDK
jgi:hypothetical protein